MQIKTRRLPIILSVALVLVIIGSIVGWEIAEGKYPIFYGDFPLVLEWTYQAPRTIESIAISPNGTILLHTSRQLIALDSETRRIIWELPIKDRVYFTTPRVVDGTVYDLDDEYLFALDETNGNLIWSNQLQADTSILEASSSHLFVNRPSEDILALDRFSGEIKWQLPASRGHTMIFVDDQVIIAVDQRIDEYQQSDGTSQWGRTAIGILQADFQNRVLYTVGSNSEELSWIEAMDVANHVRLWSRYLVGSGIPYLTATPEHVLVSLNPNIYAINPKTGDTLWKTVGRSGLKPIVFGETAYILEGASRKLLAINLATGAELGFVRLSNPVVVFTYRDVVKATEKFLVVAAGNKLFLLSPK